MAYNMMFFDLLSEVSKHIKKMNSEGVGIKSVILTYDGKWIVTHLTGEEETVERARRKYTRREASVTPEAPQA